MPRTARLAVGGPAGETTDFDADHKFSQLERMLLTAAVCTQRCQHPPQAERCCWGGVPTPPAAEGIGPSSPNLCHPKSIVSLQIHKMSHLQRILLQTSVQMIVLTSTHLPLRSMHMLASRTCTLSSVAPAQYPFRSPPCRSHPPTMRVMPAVL